MFQKIKRWFGSHEIDSEGNDSRYEKGKLIHRKNSKGGEEWYNDKGLTIHRKDSKGYEEWYEYDEHGKVIHWKDSDGNEEWYNDKGKLIHKKDSKGNEEWYEYDEHGNAIHKKDSKEYEEWCEYNGKGNILHKKDTTGYEKWYEYDDKGREIRKRDQDGNKLDVNPHTGKIFHKKTPDGWEYWYDEDGRQIEWRSPNKSRTLSVAEPKKDSKKFEEYVERNDKDRVTYKKDRYGFEEWYEYNDNGRLIHYKTSKGNANWYDDNGHIIHSINSKGNEEWYEYDDEGNRIQRTNPKGNEESYEYNDKIHKVSWYFAEDAKKNVRQVVLEIPSSTPNKSRFATLMLGAKYASLLGSNWTLGFFRMSDDPGPFLLVRAQGKHSVVNEHCTRLSFAFYKMRAAGLVATFWDCPDVAGKWSYGHVEGASSTDQPLGLEIIRDAMKKDRLEITFAVDSLSTSQYGPLPQAVSDLSVDLPKEFRDKVLEEMDSLERDYRRVPGGDGTRAMRQMWDENPPERSAIINRK